MKPADVVRKVIDAMRAGRSEEALALFAEDCVLRTPEGVFEGHDGVRRLMEQRAASGAGGMQMRAGEPEEVGNGQVLVPLKLELEMGGDTGEVRATGIWTVASGRVVGMRGIPGGRKMALAALAADSGDS